MGGITDFSMNHSGLFSQACSHQVGADRPACLENMSLASFMIFGVSEIVFFVFGSVAILHTVCNLIIRTIECVSPIFSKCSCIL